MLSGSFLALSAYAQRAIKRALGLDGPTKQAGFAPRKRDGSVVSNSSWFEDSPDISEFTASSRSLSPEISRRGSGSEISSQPSPPLAELDVSLPSVCEALVLITQCIVTITLEVEGAPTDAGNLRSLFNSAQSEAGQGLIESLVGTSEVSWIKSAHVSTSLLWAELLGLLDLFLPRINFGKPVGRPSSNYEPVQDIPGFSYLKRDLVRLLGILCNEVKAVQDRVRECGGIHILMNLCVVDERNPCAYSFEFTHAVKCLIVYLLFDAVP
jgi:Spinocerebellar ataxia type 10 protein domain